MYKLFAVVLLSMTLVGCGGMRTYVSKDLLPGYSHRPIPNIHIYELDTAEEVNEVCQSLVPGRWLWLLGCAQVPKNPNHVCKVWVKRGDEETLHHEMGHCHGYADTTNYYDAHPDYLEEQDEDDVDTTLYND